MSRFAGLTLTMILVGLPPAVRGADEASGQLTVDGVSIPLEHVYVQQELDSEGEEILTVLAMEKPLPEALLDGQNFLAGLLVPEQTACGLSFTLEADGEPWRWRLVHPSFPDGDHGIGFSTDLRVEVHARNQHRIRATAFAEKPGAWEDHRYEMRRALTFDEPEVVRVLIGRGYDVEAEAARLLEWARFNPDLAELLQQAGAAPPERKAKQEAKPAQQTQAWVPSSKPLAGSRTPRDAAKAKAELEAMELTLGEKGLFLKIMDLDPHAVLLFLEAGISPDIRDNWASKYTPLRHATSACAYQKDMAAISQVIEGLLAHGADVEDADQSGQTTLMVAAQYCPPEIVRTLLAAGASPAAVSRSGDTALSRAVEHGRAANVEALIEAGFDVARDGERLVRLAEGKPEIHALLQAALDR